MTMVRIVRTDGEPTTILPMSLAAACQHVKRNQLRTDRFYQVEFVEPVPLFDVVMHRTNTRDSRDSSLLRICRSVPLADALEAAAMHRHLHRRTVVRAAR